MAVDLIEPEKNITTARFVDTSKSLIVYYYYQREADIVEPRYVSFNPDEEECAAVLEVVPVETLEANYYDFVEQQQMREMYWQQFVDHQQDIMKIIDDPDYYATLESQREELQKFNELKESGALENLDVPIPESVRGEEEKADEFDAGKMLGQLMKMHEDKEKFFKIKLAIFEMDAVKSSKNRQWKSAMRKAVNTFALFGILQEGLEGLEDEQAESVD